VRSYGFTQHMMYRQSRFPFCQTLAIASFVFISSLVYSVELPLETRGFTPVAGGSDIIEGTALYVSSFDDLSFSASNSRDIVIIEDMTSLTVDDNNTEDDTDDDMSILISNYTGYNTVTGEEVETGSLLMEVPYAENSLYASSVKGFYRKSGPWVKRSTSQSFLLGDMTGTVSYTSLQKSREIDIVLNGTYQGTPLTLFGDTTSTVASTDYVTFGGWDADEGSTYEFSFISAALSRNGNIYTGFLRRGDESEDDGDGEPEDWEDRYAVFRVTDVNDSDGDGIPDLSDLGATEILGVLATNSIDLSNNQYWSDDLNTTISIDAKQFWIYGENIGWFYLPDQADPYAIRIYIPDERLQWLTTNADMSPYYLRESDNVPVFFNRVDGNISFYDTALQAWFTVSY